MYTFSYGRNTSLAVVLVATLAGVVAAGVDTNLAAAADAASRAALEATQPWLPEVVVTASPLEA